MRHFNGFGTAKLIVGTALIVLACGGGARAESVPLSSLDVANIQQETGRPQVDKSAAGLGLSVGGQAFAHGLGMQSPSKIIINLAGGSERFTAMVGVDDEVKEKGEGGTVTFTVTGDSRRLWPPVPAATQGARGRGRGPAPVPVIKAGDTAQKVEVDVKGVRVLVLEIGAGNDGTANDHADLIEAQLEVTGIRPQIAPISKDEPVVLTPTAPATPRINGAQVFGVRPGHPFMFTVAATGDRPMQFAAVGLPAGLTLDPATGFITGVTNTKGEFDVVLKATNSLGSAGGKLKIVVGDRIALTPQMGWNSWNCFAGNVDAEKVKAATDAMVKSGLINHGWTYVNIDDYWETKANTTDATLLGEARAADGTINPNKRFPDMKALCDYIHSHGLKAGLYSSPGPTTCGGCVASYQHEELDAMTWAKWGFDYIKYDWCSYGNIVRDQEQTLAVRMKPYQVLRDALDKCDRDILYSLCQYGAGNVWEWGDQVGGNSWRTTGDIIDTWESLSRIGFGQAGHEVFAGPGHWNDPDMLIVGYVGWGPRLHPTRLTPNEQYTHISLWSLLCSPLLIGCDMTKFDDFTLNLLTNDEVIAVNQDPAGKQAGRVVKDGEFEVWAKDMADGSKAVGIFNRSELESKFAVKWTDLGITGKKTVRDLWRQKDVGEFEGQFEASIPRHGVVLVRLGS